MQRTELSIDVVCTFAFKLVNSLGEKTFLKIYIKSKLSDPVENVTPASLQRICSVLDRLCNAKAELTILKLFTVPTRRIWLNSIC